MCFDARRPEADALMRAARESGGREVPATRPARCPACGSADIVCGIAVPERWRCRECLLIWDHRSPPPAPPEDRGTPAWIWRDADGWCSFGRPRGIAERCEVSVPIGWSLKPDPAGVVLANVFGERLMAGGVLRRAERGEGGFKVGGREETG